MAGFCRECHCKEGTDLNKNNPVSQSKYYSASSSPHLLKILLKRSSGIRVAYLTEGTCQRLESLDILAVISSYLVIIQEDIIKAFMGITDNSTAAPVFRGVGSVIFYDIALGEHSISMER